MNITHYIEHIQHKPEASRRRIFLVAMIICMVIIVGAWAVTLGSTLQLAGSTAQNNAAGLSPFSLLKDTAVKGWSGVEVYFNKPQ